MMTAIIVIAAQYLAFQVGAGHTHHSYRKAHGLAPNFLMELGPRPVRQRSATRWIPDRSPALGSCTNCARTHSE